MTFFVRIHLAYQEGIWIQAHRPPWRTKNFFEHVALPSFLPVFIRPWSFPVSLCWGRMLNCTNIAWVIARKKVPPNNNDVSQEISGGIWSALLNGMKVNGRVSAGDLTSSQWVLSLKAGYREQRLKTKHWGMSWGEGWFCPYFSVLSASPPNIYIWLENELEQSLSNFWAKTPSVHLLPPWEAEQKNCSRLG